MSDNPTNVQAKAVKQVRILETKERPGDALLEVTTGKGEKTYLLLPATELPKLAQHMLTFSARKAETARMPEPGSTA